MMDEFALFKGYRYATVVADADTQHALWVGEGINGNSKLTHLPHKSAT